MSEALDRTPTQHGAETPKQLIGKPAEKADALKVLCDLGGDICSKHCDEDDFGEMHHCAWCHDVSRAMNLLREERKERGNEHE